MIHGIKKHVVLLCLLAIGSFFTLLAPMPAYAQTENLPPSSAADNKDVGAELHCSQSFLTFPAWYRNLLNSDCEIKPPTETGGIVRFVTTILLNVVECILQASGYASVIFIIYGGYKYMISAGSPDGMVGARKTIVNAVIGLVISLGAAAIVNTIARGL